MHYYCYVFRDTSYFLKCINQEKHIKMNSIYVDMHMFKVLHYEVLKNESQYYS